VVLQQVVRPTHVYVVYFSTEGIIRPTEVRVTG